MKIIRKHKCRYTKVTLRGKFISYVYAESSNNAFNKLKRIESKNNIKHKYDWYIIETNSYFTRPKSKYLRTQIRRKFRRLFNQTEDCKFENYLRKASCLGFGWKFRQRNGVMSLD